MRDGQRTREYTARPSSRFSPSSPPWLDPPRGETPGKEHRHGQTVRSRGGYSVIGVDGRDAGVYLLRCGRWRCGNCGPRLVRRVRDRIQAGLAYGPIRFLTLTSPGTESPEQSFDELTERWKRLNLRIGRRFGPFEYAAVVELQGRGSPHLHVVMRGPFIPFPWLAKAARDVGFGPMLNIRRPESNLAGYLTKSLGPGTSGDLLPSHFHRVRLEPRLVGAGSEADPASVERLVPVAGPRGIRGPMSQPQAKASSPSADPFVRALASYVEALERRYPGGPDELRLANRARRANMPTMSDRKHPPAA